MSHYTAQSALAAMSGQPIFMEDRYAQGTEGPVSLASHIRLLASSLPDVEEAAWNRRKVEIAGLYGSSGLMADKPFIFVDGAAIIPIHGLLLNRFPYSWGFVTGYSFIRHQLAAALADDDVERIIYDVDSFGGMVGGCVETAEAMYAARKVKPSLAVIDAYCYSAGTYLATAASKVAITPSGNTGSIGVVLMRLDVTKAMEQDGWKVHLIYAGDRKVDSYPVAEFTPEARKRMQASVDRSYDTFVSSVAKYRGMDETAVRATQAACFDAEEALALGLVDTVIPASEAMLATAIWDDDGQHAEQEQDDMTTKPTPAEEAAATAAAAQAATDAAATQAAAVSNAAQAAQVAERARIAAIQDSDEAKDKPALARHLALSTDMTAEAARAILKAAAPETAPAKPAGNPLAAAMDGVDQPNVGGGTGSTAAAGATAQTPAQRIIAAQRAATGYDHTKH